MDKIEKENTASPAERAGSGLNTISQTLLPFARQLLGKKGFVEIDILTGWSRIIGKELAQYSFPQKISFPRGEKTNGILHLCTTSGAFALEISHREKIIIDKINTYFGYNAVSGIKIIQNLNLSAEKNNFVNEYEKTYTYKLNKEEEKYIENLAAPIDNKDLKAIIAKLGKSVFNKNKNKK